MNLGPEEKERLEICSDNCYHKRFPQRLDIILFFFLRLEFWFERSMFSEQKNTEEERLSTHFLV